MSNLVNRHWINFDGESVTGRTPPSVFVYGPPMTPQQFGEVAHTYKLFTDANLVALGDYQVRNRVLRDGTRVRCLSINGVDTVYVWTNREEKYRLGAFFYCVPSTLEKSPFFDDLPSAVWAYRGEEDPPQKLRPRRVITPSAGIRQHPGSITWFNSAIKARFPESKVNKDTVVVSWDSWETRYCIREHYDFFLAQAWRFRPYVWIDGVRRNVSYNGQPVGVMSAALKEDGEDLYFYAVVTNGMTLSVVRSVLGVIHAPGDIEVDLVFVIDYKIGFPIGASVEENLIQPPFFNKSCTKIATIVTVNENSPINPAAHQAVLDSSEIEEYNDSFVLMLVDVDGKTTSFTTEHIGVREELDIDEHSAAYPQGADLGSFHSNRTDNYETLHTNYGAVDFKEDVLRIVLVERRVTEIREYNSSYALGAGSLSHTGAASVISNRGVSTGYRVYSTDLSIDVSKDFPLVSFGQVVANSSYSISAWEYAYSSFWEREVTVYSVDVAENYAENDNILMGVFVVGGDLRFDTIVIEELIETGACVEAASYAGTVDSGEYHRGNPTTTAEVIASHWPLYAFQGNHRSQQVSGKRRLGTNVVAYKENGKVSEVLAGESAIASYGRPWYGYYHEVPETSPLSGSLTTPQWLLDISTPLQYNVVWDRPGFINADMTSRPSQSALNVYAHPLVVTPHPRARHAAFSTDGQYGVVSLGQPPHSGVPVTENKFLIEEAWVFAPQTLPDGLEDAGHEGLVLTSPIFLNQSVEPLK